MDTINKVSNVTQNKLDQLLGNPYVMAVLKVVLVLYASQIAPKLPSLAQNTLQNTFVKIICISLIAYLAELDFQLSIILAIIFVLSTNLLSGRSIFESYQNVDYGIYHSDESKYNDLLGNPARIGTAKIQESATDNYPGCNKVTMNDLLALFDGDAMKLQKTVQYAMNDIMQRLPENSDAKEKLTKMAYAVGLPYNVEFNDLNAPLIATFLLNYGYKVSEECQVPQ